MSHAGKPSPHNSVEAGRRSQASQVIVVGSIMLTFISFWRVAAVVLCDMASTAFYIGGIVEQLVGTAAPWFILAVMIFSYAVRSVYIESCSMFVRGGVYRVVKQALGGLPAKGAVSALLFDYVLTGPISSVSAGQYLVGLALDTLAHVAPEHAIHSAAARNALRSIGSVVIACLITLYFFRKNIIGIHESSDKALRIMWFTTVIAAIVLGWSGITLAMRGPANTLASRPDLSEKVEYETVPGEDRATHEHSEIWKRDDSGAPVPKRDTRGNPIPKLNPVTGHQEDPLGFLPDLAPHLAEEARHPASVWTLAGLFGLLVAFGHSILAMSGEETLAQVYRDVEAPKLNNFEKAGFMIFVYSLALTAGTSFLAVLLIPDEIRTLAYSDNLLGGLAMHVIGPPSARLVLNALVVVAGFLILSGAVNTSIIGSNGVLNRVADDGVLSDWWQNPHPQYGTTYRLLRMIFILQLAAIVFSRGNMILLGEAYAFGVVWSFAMKAISMVALRFQDRRPREFKVPLNLRIGSVELPVGLAIIALLLTATACVNLLTKEVATVSGLAFTVVILAILMVSERKNAKSRHGATPEHLEQVSQNPVEEVSDKSLGLTLPFRKLVAVRSSRHLEMLQHVLEESDPETTEIIVMKAKTTPAWGSSANGNSLDRYDQQLITAIIEMGEAVGKPVKPLLVPTNNVLYAIVKTARALRVQELIVGVSHKIRPRQQIAQLTYNWGRPHADDPAPLTIRVLDRNFELYEDIGGGSRIPKIGEKTKWLSDKLRADGAGSRRVLMTHDGTPAASQVLESVLAVLDPAVHLGLVAAPAGGPQDAAGRLQVLKTDQERLRKSGREFEIHEIAADSGAEIVRVCAEQHYELIILYSSATRDRQIDPVADWVDHIHAHAPCLVLQVNLPAVARDRSR